MKKQLLILAFLIALLTGPDSPVSQVLPESEPTTGGDSGVNDFPLLFFNLETWEVTGSNLPSSDLSAFNTPEQIESRKLGALAMDDPDEYERRFPRDSQEIEKRAAAAALVENPPTHLNLDDKSADERKQIEDAVLAITDPERAMARFGTAQE